MVQEQTSCLEGTQATDEAIRSRVDELLAGMTAAEKAGQLPSTSISAYEEIPRIRLQVCT